MTAPAQQLREAQRHVPPGDVQAPRQVRERIALRGRSGMGDGHTLGSAEESRSPELLQARLFGRALALKRAHAPRKCTGLQEAGARRQGPGTRLSGSPRKVPCVAEPRLHNRHEVRDAISAVDHQARHQPCPKSGLPQGSLAGASHHTTWSKSCNSA